MLMFYFVVARGRGPDFLQGGRHGSLIETKKGRAHPAALQSVRRRGRLALVGAETAGQRRRRWYLGLIIFYINEKNFDDRLELFHELWGRWKDDGRLLFFFCDDVWGGRGRKVFAEHFSGAFL